MSCRAQNVLVSRNLHYKLNPQSHLSTRTSCGAQNVLFSINLQYKLNPQTHLSTQPECHVELRTLVRRNLHYKIEPSNSPLRQHTPTLKTRALKHLSQQKPPLQTRTLKLTSQPEGPVEHRTHSSEETYTTNENPQNSPLSQQTPTLQIRTLKPTSQSAGPPDPAGCRKTCRSAGRCAQTWGRHTCGTSTAPPA